MSELTQQESELLIALEKLLSSPKKVNLPPQGEKNYHKVTNLKKDINFDLTLSRGKRNPKKASYQLMYKNNIILLRVDTEGGMHYNHDGTVIPAHTPHIHIYQEGHESHQAYRLPKSFSNQNDICVILLDFLSYSNIINVNEVKICIQGGLFHGSDT